MALFTRSRALSGSWLVLGLLCVGLGGVGVVVPGLPTTVFFIVAAGCFARSSPRLETWVLGLPGVGPAVRDYRAGLGMPPKAKIWAIGSIVVFSGLAVGLAVPSYGGKALIIVAALVGVAFLLWRVPTHRPPAGKS